MNDCPTCGYPMVYSDELKRVWCSVYGSHRERFTGRNVVIGARPAGSVSRVDFNRKEWAA